MKESLCHFLPSSSSSKLGLACGTHKQQADPWHGGDRVTLPLTLRRLCWLKGLTDSGTAGIRLQINLTALAVRHSSARVALVSPLLLCISDFRWSPAMRVPHPRWHVGANVYRMGSTASSNLVSFPASPTGPSAHAAILLLGIVLFFLWDLIGLNMVMLQHENPAFW